MSGATYTALVFGDSLDEIELKADESCRAFFGEREFRVVEISASVAILRRPGPPMYQAAITAETAGTPPDPERPLPPDYDVRGG